MAYRFYAMFALASMLCISSIRLYATVPDREPPEIATKSEMAVVISVCHLADKFSPAGEKAALKYHYLYRFHDGCEQGKFGSLCPSVLIGIQRKSCSKMFYSGPDVDAISLGEASILVPEARIELNKFKDQNDVQAFSMETKGGLVVVVDRDHAPVFYVREYKE